MRGKLLPAYIGNISLEGGKRYGRHEEVLCVCFFVKMMGAGY